MTTPLSKLNVAQDARTLVDQALARAGTAGKAQVEALLVEAAAQNGNKHLSAAEARAVVDAFEKVSAGTAGVLAAPALDEAIRQANATLKAMKSASNVDGISTHFTFNEKLSARIVAELNDTVTRANGRPVDINMMIFEFQSDEIGAAIVDIARKNPNVNVRIIADSGQATDSGGNELGAMLKQHLPNIQVKYKKDFPYSWDATRKMPKYNHGATQGLLHHKGFSTFIDGKPDRLVAGSFNWSNTADQSNYEDLTVFKNQDASSRRGIEQWGQEFAGFFNNQDACLSPNNFSNFKKLKWNEMVTANGGRPLLLRPLPDDNYASYKPATDGKSFDLNGWRATDAARLKALVGAAVAKDILAARKAHGRFDSLEELATRVPSSATLTPDVLAALRDNGFCGAGTVSINNATVEELDLAGFSKADATAIVAWREQHGDFDNMEQLRAVPGITAADLSRMRPLLSAVDVEVFFNSRPFGTPAGGTGYGPDGTRTTAAADATGNVGTVAANVTVGATDLFNRAKAGDVINVAMYGLSISSPECQSLLAAAARGAVVKIVVDDTGTSGVVPAIKAAAARGANIEIRIQTSKTMHEKFGVVGDDVFAGSANFSTSSSTKHSENRFSIKNDPETAAQFQGRFQDIWDKSRVQ